MKNNETPRHVLFIEEAHNIAGRTDRAAASPDVADPKAFAVEFLCRMLAELRASQVGIIVVDQLPSAVAPEVIKIPAFELAFRQVADEDRMELAAAMLLGHWGMEEMARLNPGEAFIYTEGFYKPRQIKAVNLHNRFDFSTPITNEKIIPYIQNDAWYKKAAFKRGFCLLERLRESLDEYDNLRIAMTRDLVELRGKHAQIIAAANPREKSKRLADLKSEARSLEKRFNASYRLFIKSAYRKYLPSEKGQGLNDPALQEMKDDLVNRFESIIQPEVQETLDRIKSFIGSLEPSGIQGVR